MVWGAASTDKPLPQDGDGLAGPSHSAAVAIGELQITVLPADTNTLAIAGCTLTAKTTAAAKNQWTIGASIATCCTNLVALINTYGTGTAQCDVATPSTVCALLLALPYFVYARVKPGTTDTVQIATRIAGVSCNHATNANMLLTHSGWATPPTFTQFAGGASGPFAYIATGDTVFGRSFFTYGIWFAAPSSVVAAGASDVTHVRTKRSGSNLTATCTFSNSNAQTPEWRNTSFLYDDGTIWNDGSSSQGQLTFHLRSTHGSAQFTSFRVSAWYAVVHQARSQYGLRILCYIATATSFSSLSFYNVSASGAFINCLIERDASGALCSICFAETAGGGTVSSTANLTGSKCKQIGTTGFAVLANTSTANIVVTLDGFVSEVVSATGIISSVVYVAQANQSGGIRWVGGKIYDTNGVYKCANPVSVSTTAVALSVIVDSVDGVSSQSASLPASRQNLSSLIFNSPEGSNKAYLVTNGQYTVDWKDDGTFPYCGTAADLRGVNWAHRITWTNIPLPTFCVAPITLRYFHRSAAAVRTITCELYTPDATTFYKSELTLLVSYIDNTGGRRTEETLGNIPEMYSGTNAVLDSSSTTWTANGVTGFSAEMLELTTDYSVKQDSEITAILTLKAPRSPTIVFYVSPELGVV